MLPSKTHRALVLPAVGVGGGGVGGAWICFVKQGESELAVCVQRREECFVQGWSIMYQTPRWSPPRPTTPPPHRSNSEITLLKLTKSGLATTSAANLLPDAEACGKRKNTKIPVNEKWGDGVHVLRGSL